MPQPPPQFDEVWLKGYDPNVTRRLVGFLGPYWLKFWLAMALMLINSAAAVAGPYLVKVALDSGIDAGSVTVLRQTVLLYLFLAGIQWITTFLRVNIMARVGQSIIYDLRARLFEHLQGLSLSFYNRFSVGRVFTRVVNDVSVLREFISFAVLAIARDLFALVGIIVAMLSMDLRLSLLTFTVLPFMTVATVIFRKRARQNYRLVRIAISWVNSVLAENINGVRVVQAFSREATNFGNFRDEVNLNNLNTNLRAARIASAFPAAIDFLGTVATALVIWLGGSAVVGSQITPGVLVAFVLYIDRFFDPIRDLSRRYDSFQSTMAAGERIFALLDTPSEVTDAAEATELPFIKGDVTFEDVSFHYTDDQPAQLLTASATGGDGAGASKAGQVKRDGHSSPPQALPAGFQSAATAASTSGPPEKGNLPDSAQQVLEHINLHVPAGQTVALVGETGAGKSTLIKLLSRFHDPSEGQVLVDGYNLRHVTQNSLRSQMGIVLQDPFLFNGTIKENIRFGRLEADDAEIEAAAKAVGAHEFIIRQREGYDTSVEEGGTLLSVGQRQLISFARALLADPRILILDEATSSVDTQTERTIQNALARLLHGRTAFVIAHRLSTVVNADRIVVIHDGRIVEQGTHNTLLALGGHYHRLYSMGFEE
jgi:ABC-type multidrug transport system fused ATPase/permease subunit